MHRRTAIVTGAAQGIGEAIARRLAEDGHAVALLDVDPQGAEMVAGSINAAGGVADAFKADVTQAADVEDAVRTIAATLGPPTILVNNAGFARDSEMRDMPDVDWDAVLAVHLTGSFRMARAVEPYMRSANWGRIVNISSTSAQGHAGRVNYCAAKAGMHGLVKGLAVELGPQGVTVNAVAPGFTLTAMTSVTAARKGLTLEEHLLRSAASLPVRRVGQPMDVAHAVSYFTSEGAGFVTGQVLYVAGGPED